MKKTLKKAALITLGCPKNQVDSEVVAGMLESNGVRLTVRPEEADAVLINTCGFIRDAKRESIQAVRRCLGLKRADPDKAIVVWGCLAERYRGQIEKKLAGADAFFGVEPFDAMARFLIKRPRTRNGSFPVRTISTPPHTAYLKIAEGCDHACTFCSIPQFKGHYRSRPMESLVAEAEWLADQGVREIILIAQDTTAYGSDLGNGSSLATLLMKLASIRQLRWIRNLYMHPAHVTDGMIEVFSGEKKVCRYADMPLQHVADSVLTAMGRGMSRKEMERLIVKLRRLIPGLTLRSTFIVGFPGESERAFRELREFVRETRFERLGIFRYSREPRTRAAAMRRTVPAAAARKRHLTLMEMQKRISSERNRSLESEVITVLVDGYDVRQGIFFGRSEGDAPEIDQTVWVRGPAVPGQFVDVVVEGSSAYDLFGRPTRLKGAKQ